MCHTKSCLFWHVSAVNQTRSRYRVVLNQFGIVSASDNTASNRYCTVLYRFELECRYWIRNGGSISIQACAANAHTDMCGTGSIQYGFRSWIENRFLGVYVQLHWQRKAVVSKHAGQTSQTGLYKQTRVESRFCILVLFPARARGDWSIRARDLLLYNQSAQKGHVSTTFSRSLRHTGSGCLLGCHGNNT